MKIGVAARQFDQKLFFRLELRLGRDLPPTGVGIAGKIVTEHSIELLAVLFEVVRARVKVDVGSKPVRSEQLVDRRGRFEKRRQGMGRGEATIVLGVVVSSAGRGASRAVRWV